MTALRQSYIRRPTFAMHVLVCIPPKGGTAGLKRSALCQTWDHGDDGSVHHSQALHAVHPQLRVDHRAGSGRGAHLAGPHDGVAAVQRPPDVVVDGRIILRRQKADLTAATGPGMSSMSCVSSAFAMLSLRAFESNLGSALWRPCGASKRSRSCAGQRHGLKPTLVLTAGVIWMLTLTLPDPARLCF